MTTCPDEKWYRLFLVCFPNLALWQAQLLSKGTVATTGSRSYENICTLEQPNRIYNCNKTGFPMAPHPTKVIASKGNPHMYQQGASTKAQITVLLTASATTYYIPPTCGLSRSKFLNNNSGSFTKFSHMQCLDTCPQVDGSGPVLQLAKAKLHPRNPKTSCPKAGTATY